jgi:hypothetical protein
MAVKRSRASCQLSALIGGRPEHFAGGVPPRIARLIEGRRAVPSPGEVAGVECQDGGAYARQVAAGRVGRCVVRHRVECRKRLCPLARCRFLAGQP